ncbi:MAG TPA: hypothetical protein VIW67_07285 [Terriglobales bacterium]|jgi:hypothetical protein
MTRVLRIFVVVLALAGVIAWTIFTSQVWQFGNSFKGMGDGAGAGDGGGSALLNVLLIVVIWLLPVSPYLCMAAGSLNLIAGKALRVAYVYSLVLLSIMTLIMLMSFQRRLEFTALGNIVAGGLWAYGFRESATGTEKREAPA